MSHQLRQPQRVAGLERKPFGTPSSGYSIGDYGPALQIIV